MNDPSKLYHIQILNSKSGLPTAKIFNTTENHTFLIHSAYNPKQEAIKVVNSWEYKDKSLIIVLGCGLGYPVKELINRTQSKIIVIESDPRFLKIKESVVSSLNNRRVSFLTGSLDSLDQSLMNLISDKDLTSLSIVEYTPCLNINPHYYNEVKKLLKQVLRMKKGSLLSNIGFGKRWVLNSLNNLPLLKNYFRVCIQKKPRVPILIIAAGPSLKESLPLIKNLFKNSWVIAVAPAMNFLKANQLYPDLIVSIDGGIHNRVHLRDIKVKNTGLLLTNISVNDQVIKEYPGKKIIIHTGLETDSYFLGTSPKGIMKLPMAGTVTATAMAFAASITNAPIILAGLDLAFPNGMYHSPFNAAEVTFLLQSNRMVTPYTKLHRLLSQFDGLQVQSNEGTEVWTNQAMHSYSRWFSMFVRQIDNPVYTLSRKGVQIERIKYIKAPSQANLDGYADKKPNLMEIMDENSMDQTDITTKLNHLIEIVQSYSTSELMDHITKASDDNRQEAFSFIELYLSRYLYTSLQKEEALEKHNDKIVQEIARLRYRLDKTLNQFIHLN